MSKYVAEYARSICKNMSSFSEPFALLMRPLMVVGVFTWRPLDRENLP